MESQATGDSNDYWKINSHLIYDFLYAKNLEWPATSAKWVL